MPMSSRRNLQADIHQSAIAPWPRARADESCAASDEARTKIGVDQDGQGGLHGGMVPAWPTGKRPASNLIVMC